MRKAKQKDFWTSFQSYLSHNRIPEFIVQILKKPGYDTPFSVQLLDENKVKDIDESITKRLNSIKYIFENTEYESVESSSESFELLPGHKTLLLGLTAAVKKYVDETTVKQKQKISLPTIIEENETVEILTEEERTAAIQKLIQKVTKFSKKYRLSVENISENNIISELNVIINTSGSVVYKCSFSCVIDACKVIVFCVFNKHWQISNLERHIKTHIEARKSRRKIKPNFIKRQFNKPSNKQFKRE